MSANKQVVLLTGASRGIGLAIARILLRGSASVPASRLVTLSRSHPEALQALEKEHKDDLICVQGDVTDEAVNRKAVAAAKERWGRLDGLILNSGMVLMGRVGEQSAADFFQVQNVNLLSLHLTLLAALPLLRESPTGCGKAVFVSSGAAVGNTASWAAYNVSKAGMNALARTLASEEKGDSTRGRKPVACFSVRPGVVDTEMQNELRSRGSDHLDAQTYEYFKGLHTGGKLLRPEQPGHVIAALAVNATRDEPRAKDGEGLGAQGAFFNWNAEELLQGGWQLPEGA